MHANPNVSIQEMMKTFSIEWPTVYQKTSQLSLNHTRNTIFAQDLSKIKHIRLDILLKSRY